MLWISIQSRLIVGITASRLGKIPDKQSYFLRNKLRDLSITRVISQLSDTIQNANLKTKNSVENVATKEPSD